MSKVALITGITGQDGAYLADFFAHYGLPIAATNVEGIPEVVLDQQTGLLCDPKDEKALAMNILKLINDSELRITLGNAGRERVHKMFTNLLMVENYKKKYQR